MERNIIRAGSGVKKKELGSIGREVSVRGISNKVR
jgi:hypothetical protein